VLPLKVFDEMPVQVQANKFSAPSSSMYHIAEPKVYCRLLY